ncbi:MAG TPA: TIGR03557 family F420-dependent LLM class oxidoreductase [Thermomicrobiaceae bacterium]|nr:TIGR03557 family F420-dependent LLM class oxidoreductase [Thermomicrobiaceae bacterium]
MTEFGYALSSEEHPAPDLVRYAQMAEQSGFSFCLISDHFLPWLDTQGQAPFAWTTIGAIAQATRTLRLGTGVTCPLIRYHPAIVAQAAATAASLMPGRFFLGVGSGERLNEHILGSHWPEVNIRHDMLIEAIDLIRTLWQGDMQSFYGDYFTVENAQIYSLPSPLPPIYVGASGQDAVELAGQIGDGLISTAPEKELVQAFEQAGGQGKPRYGQTTVCYAPSEAEARKIAHQCWPEAVLGGQLSQEIALPQDFAAASASISEEQVAEVITCGPDPARHLQSITQFVDAGYDHVYVHNVGPHQEGFFELYQREVLPKLS